MSKSITHLVCWKFEGKKYDIARKLRIHIVNHRWIEDCIKEGRRVPEDSYILQSGYEVGPLLIEVPFTVQASSLSKNKVVSGRFCDIGPERQNTDFSAGVCEISVLEDSCLLKKHEESSSYSSRLSRKGKRNSGNEVKEESSSYSPRLSRKGKRNTGNEVNEESSSYSSRLSRKGKRNSGNEISTAARRSRKERRVVKYDDEGVLDPIILDLSTDDELSRMDRLHTEAAATSTLPGRVNVDNIQENSEGLDAGLCRQSRTIDRSSDGIEQTRSSTLSIEDPFPVTQTSVDLCSSAAEKFNDGDPVDNSDDLPTSNELSCVICFTDFSSTRGILACGHRFCFKCIQDWVDRRIAMGKISNCPLCKASITMIKKVEHAATTDQKVYSQSIPCDYTSSDIFIPMEQEFPHNNLEAGACVICRGREPEDLLENCDVCRTRRIHSYCMDPPLRPWTCSSCKELRMLYRNHSY
ncbi:uncharacterized protein [Cicer arietinum]|uniref:RING-type E3 ubiquitin transferase BRCA1 n=1 Tax=Cicer arietinum TaxID=3827 RepID=A0A1S2YN24_CICAR|nr:uncharacterized protein LOC101495587 isoform X1 [Cicer arietinum]